ncbi:MAG: NTP transferase domain-containing protein, partial [Planctomycetaceae bacterium]
MTLASNLNVLIPMAGVGKRFQDAGYDNYKPFIEVAGKPMIHHALDPFPEDVDRHIITVRDLLTPENEAYLRDELRCNIVFITPHSEGPAFTINEAAKHLPQDVSYFITYCDVSWSWDFKNLRSHLDQYGLVIVHEGFHPQLIDNNFSAFCRAEQEHPDRLAEIREKGSFTDRWMEEPVSIGAFYVRNGRQMFEAIRKTVDENDRAAGELYPSLMFNRLLNDGLQIGLYATDFYIHWGVPEQLEDYNRWAAIVKWEETNVEHKTDMPQNVMLMAGLGSRMENISQEPKALIPVKEKPLYLHAADRMPSAKTIKVVSPTIAQSLREEDLKSLVVLKRQTSSQLETLTACAEQLASMSDFYLSACDAYGKFDYQGFREHISSASPDAVIFTFEPSLIQSKRA